MRGGWFRFFVDPRCFCSHSSDSELLAIEAAGVGRFYSPRIAEMIKNLKNNPGMDKVESEIEASKPTWSELSTSSLVGEALAADNSRAFKRLRDEWLSEFFQEWKEGEWELLEKIAEGGQAELYELRRMQYTNDDPWVMKIFKEGLRLHDLQTLLPLGMLADEKTRRFGYFNGGQHCNTIRGAMLFNGRFALLMDRKWGDLRKLIDGRMMDNNMRQPPFSYYGAVRCMLQIATGMKELHEKNIIHGDLKAANVLVSRPLSQRDGSHLLDPRSGVFKCEVADYECSVGVVGTGFWRAPEILLAVKNRNVTPELFTKASDVYSYAMTCYEILTGRIPFEAEGVKGNEYQRVIDGYRPCVSGIYESGIYDEHFPQMEDLLSSCWLADPLQRPTFHRIAAILVNYKYVYGEV